MRTYFTRVPKWARQIYPLAIWEAGELQSDEDIIWTFDDGPHPESTPRYLELLERYQIKGLFFLNGYAAERYPDLVNRIRAEGHEIGSHGHEHLDGWRTEKTHYIDDVYRSLELLGTDLYRPPYGRMTLGQYHAISSKCQVVMWSVMPGDFDESISSQVLMARLSRVTKGDIVVLHDSPECMERSLAVLPDFL